MRICLAVLFAAFAVLVLARPSGGGAQAALDWRRCDGDFECATVPVPLDYDDPGGPTVELSVLRLPARDPENRIGALFVNPGGPGASAVSFARSWAGFVDRDVLDRFDIVAFDPRGVGGSAGIDCHDSIQDYIAADPSPDDEAEFDQLAAENERFADLCAERHGDLLPHVGTKNAARDMDRIREAMGDAQLTYVGFSYGSVIGQVYADMFPGQVRAMVLDGAVDLALDGDELAQTQALGFERALESYAADCRERSCPLAEDGRDPMEAIDEVLRRVEEAPIPAPDADRPAGPGEAFYALVEPLYSTSRWPDLTHAIEEALAGDGSPLVRLADRYLRRSGDGSYGTMLEANLAVNCVDYPPSQLPKTYAAYPEVAREAAEAAPHFGPGVSTGLGCASWAAEPDPLAPPDAAGIPPIVVVATTRDPATPYEWGVAVAGQLPGSALVTYGGDGHTAYTSGDECVEGHVNDYLIGLELPPADAFCGDPSLAAPTPTATPTAEPTPDEPSPAASATDQAPTEPTATQPAPPATGSEEDADEGLSPWAWAGIVAAGVVLVGAVTVLAVRRR